MSSAAPFHTVHILPVSGSSTAQTFNRFYNQAEAESPLASQFAQQLQQNKFGQLDADSLPSSGVGPQLSADVEKRAAIKEAFVWSWEAYEKHAWGSDEVSRL